METQVIERPIAEGETIKGYAGMCRGDGLLFVHAGGGLLVNVKFPSRAEAWPFYCHEVEITGGADGAFRSGTAKPNAHEEGVTVDG